MITEGDDIRKINFDELISRTLANITDTDLLSVIDQVVNEDDDIAYKDWRDGLE